MNYFYLSIGILCALGGIGIMVWLMIPPKWLRDRRKEYKQNPFQD